MANVSVTKEGIRNALNVLNAMQHINARIASLERLISRTAMTGAPSEMRAQQYDGIPGGRSQPDTLEVARQLLSLKARLADELQRKRAITDAISALPEESAALLEHRYVMGETADDVAALLTDFDTRKFYRKLKAAVAGFAIQYYGSSVIEGVLTDVLDEDYDDVFDAEIPENG